MARFKEGDRVRYVGPEFEYSNECGYVYVYKGMSVGEHKYLMRFNFEWYDDLEVYHSDLELIYSKPDELKKCECGAHATSFKNFHSDWCPMYKEVK